MTDVPVKHRRRFVRFSLRAMLMLVLVIALPLGWILHLVRQQRVIVGELKRLQCRIDHIYDVSPPVLEKLRAWSGDEHAGAVVGVSADGSQLSDAVLKRLGGLPKLERLRLDGTPVTAAGFVYLEPLTQLRDLSLTETAITDAGLVHLEPLTKLEYLYLSQTQVTDAGVEALQEILPKLRIAH